MFVPLRLAQRTLARDRQANTLLLAATSGGSEGRNAWRWAGPRISRTSACASGRCRPVASFRSRARARSWTMPWRRPLEAPPPRSRWTSTPVLTYLANSLRHGAHEVPYSLVAGLGPSGLSELTGKAEVGADQVVLGEWAARDLEAKIGDTVDLDYYVWQEEGAIETRTARFTVGAIVPLAGPAADPDLSPSYPGITDSTPSLGLGPAVSDRPPQGPAPRRGLLARPPDDAQGLRTPGPRPGALGPSTGQDQLVAGLARGRSRPRRGAIAVRRRSSRGARAQRTLASLVQAVRADGLAAAQGSTDFGEYFVYFSFFLVVSALLLAGLFFRLGVEQRLAEVGLLEAVGFSARRVRGQFLAEGLVVAAVGSLAGAALAGGYAQLVLLGLRTIWRGCGGDRSPRASRRAGRPRLRRPRGARHRGARDRGGLADLRRNSHRGPCSPEASAPRAGGAASASARGLGRVGLRGPGRGPGPGSHRRPGARRRRLLRRRRLPACGRPGLRMAPAHPPVSLSRGRALRPRAPQRFASTRAQPPVHRPRGCGQLRGRGRGRVPARRRGRDQPAVGSGWAYPHGRVALAPDL